MKKNILIGGFFFMSSFIYCQGNSVNKKNIISISKVEKVNKKVDSLLSLMTLEEKIGQMNQYNGFWDLTGPAPKDGAAAKKYEHLRKGFVGSMLNVRGVKEVTKVQKIAVEESRLGIPLIIGFDVIHGYKTVSYTHLTLPTIYSV